MGANIIKDGQGNPIGFACSRGLRIKRCEYERCANKATKLCDHRASPKAKTCDMSLCNVHAVEQPSTEDFCPHHAVKAKEKVS